MNFNFVVNIYNLRGVHDDEASRLKKIGSKLKGIIFPFHTRGSETSVSDNVDAKFSES